MVADSFPSFSYQRSLIVFHWNLSDSKFPQVSKTHLSILVGVNNAVVWMVSTRLLISMSSSPYINPLVTLLGTLVTTDNTITFMFHIFFNSLARSRYLSPVSAFFSFILWFTIRQFLIFLLTITWSCCLSEIK